MMVPVLKKSFVPARNHRSQELACTDCSSAPYQPIQLNFGTQISFRTQMKILVYKSFVHERKHTSQKLACTDCSSAPNQPRMKNYNEEKNLNK